ncbi:Von Willebrand factor type A domain protein [Sulfitobacter noctilucae]|uniref:DUF1194 domain-containing protein n=1 Tax=Sulfitobacter noctilucae TaxID=1342302 RepID=UPI00046A0124|nr:DUF1194 domain-containing protein [Sulfitobacter noctilucae]KIN61664.1 Von Willebrand factor type A domain protein [Sulfitobacter noctilucae]
MIRAVLFALLIAAPGIASANCRLALLLAVDVSSSVDATEDQLQRSGIVAALTAPNVIAAFLAADQPVALAAYEWSGRYQQDVLLDWMLINSKAALITAAETIAATKRQHADYPTAIGYALGYGKRMLERGPRCDRQTIDMAGDGQNNDGFGPRDAYAAYPFHGITVNGLAINAADFEGELGLIAFYRAEVLHGPGAFLEVANGFEDFERAMRRKLEREVAPPVMGSTPAMEPKG